MSAQLPRPIRHVKVSAAEHQHLRKWLSDHGRNPCLWLTSTDRSHCSELARFLYHQWKSRAVTIAWDPTGNALTYSLDQLCCTLSRHLQVKATTSSEPPTNLTAEITAFESAIVQLSAAFKGSQGPVVGIFPSIDSIRAKPCEIIVFLDLLQKWQATGRFRLFLTTRLLGEDAWTSSIRRIWTNHNLYTPYSHLTQTLQFPKATRLPYDPTDRSKLAGETRSPYPVPSNEPTKGSDVLGELYASSSSPEQLAVDWWNKYMCAADMNEIRKKTLQYFRESGTRVKVAVLDTGYKKARLVANMDQTSNESPNPELVKRIKGEKSFVNGSDIEDQVGHGDDVMQVLHLAAPDADLYIAKICNTKAIGEVEKLAIVEAIEWALEQHVDIISLSLGYKTEHEGILKAIKKSYIQNVLVFAAAGKDGLNSDCPYPAQHSTVISINSATALGNISNTATASNHSAYQFTCLGEGIDVKAMLNNKASVVGQNLLSGTSFATPFAVSIAVMVLGFAAQHAKKENLDEDTVYINLHDPLKMSKVLKRMSQSAQGFDYLRPWTFFEKPFYRDWKPQEIYLYNQIEDLAR